jgi:endogenous inhibitor of DNA gyrase (YacG/DUF329 family)
MRKKCVICKKWYVAVETHGVNKRQLYCSSICRQKAWRLNNPDKHKEHSKKWRDAQLVLCRYCGKPIPLERRSSGVVFCSDTCRTAKVKADTKKYRDKVQRLFRKYKESIGCEICGYNKCGDALDYHHTDKKKKERRISAKMWYSNSTLIQREIKKCRLLCSNCHDELHFKEREVLTKENGDVY